MDDLPYSKREQDEYRKDVISSLIRIEQQVLVTNGRVTTLERWQSYVIGFCAAVTLLILPFAFMALKQFLLG